MRLKLTAFSAATALVHMTIATGKYETKENNRFRFAYTVTAINKPNQTAAFSAKHFSEVLNISDKIKIKH